MKGDLFKVGIKSVTTESCNLFQLTFSRSPARENHERRPVQSCHEISQDGVYQLPSCSPKQNYDEKGIF